MTATTGGWGRLAAKETRMVQAARTFVEIVRYSRTDVMELYLGILAMVWGAALLNPLASAFASTPSYSAMARLAPEWVWGVGAALVGLGILVALLFDGIRWRRVGAFAGLCYWLFVASTFAIGNLAGVGWIVYGVIAAGHAHAFLRLGAPR